MATYSVNVTESYSYFPDNISGSQATVFAVTNSLAGASYYTLETVPPFGWYYSGSTPSISGSFTYTSGINNLVSDNYKMSVVVAPGGGSFTFTPAVPVTGSQLRLKGTGGAPFYNYLLDIWPNATAAYSLRQLQSYYNGPALRVRRSLDSAEQNIGFVSGALDTTSLTNFVNNSGNPLPVDYKNGATVGYSLRYISSNYSGSVVRVRRSSDNIEADFTPSQITDGTLVTWVGVGNNGFVTAWYDQSGNNKTASQTSAIRQPQIVSSSVLLTENGRPTLTFGGSAFLSANSVTAYQPVTAYFLASFLINGSSAVQFTFDSFDSSTSARLGFAFFGSTFDFFTVPGTDVVQAGYTFSAQPRVFSILYSGSSSNLNLNTALQYSGNPGTGYINGLLTIGSRYLGDLRTGGNIAEFVIHNSNDSVDRFNIECNMNNYYSAFPTNGFVTTWYDQSGNGNNATQTTAANQPQIVSSGSIITLNSKPSLLTDGTNDSFTISTINTSGSNFTLFNVGKRSAAAVKYVGMASSTFPGQGHIFWNDNKYYLQKSLGYLTSGTTYATANHQIMSGVDLQTTATNTQYVNGSVIASTFSGYSFTQNFDSLFSIETTNFSSGNCQEIILWLSNQTSNLSGINTNMNAYYGIY